MERTKKIWYAVNAMGQGFVFTTLPIRNEYHKTWEGEIIGCVTSLVMLMWGEGFMLPPLKWTDEPVELSITIKGKYNV